MTNGFLNYARESFEAWQWHADAVYQQWMKNPLLINAVRDNQDQMLQTYALSRQWSQQLFGTSSLLESTLHTLNQATRAVIPIAATPHQVVYEEDRLRVLRFQPRKPKEFGIPLLIVNSLVNRYYLLDLTPGRSLIEYLTDLGFDVYSIDWGTPLNEDCTLTLDDFVCRYIPHCVAAVQKWSGSRQVSILGYSMGGVLSLMYSALYPSQVANLVLFATPVDFSQAGVIHHWINQNTFNLDRLIETCGNVPGELILASFRTLKPVSNLTLGINFSQYVTDPEHFRALLAVETWFNDCVAIPGEFYRQFVKATYYRNSLVRGKLKFNGRQVNLKNITCPILNVCGDKDQVVPPECSSVLWDLVGSDDYHEVVFPFGHLSMSVGTGAKTSVWPKTAEWLMEKSVYQGSGFKKEIRTKRT